MEDRNSAEYRVVLVLMENGKECKRNLSVGDATMLALRQDMARLFGLEGKSSSEIIRVESGDDDGFIGALISGMEEVDPEDAKQIVEVSHIEDYE